jgi:TetR/AcrR family acrAB operon transcriptional repressor
MSGRTATSSTRYERVLEAAGRLFARWGYDKTSVEDIAREAGISKGAVYLEFPNKDALLKAVLYREFARYSADWLLRFQEDTEEWSFSQMCRHSIEAVNANPFVKAVMTSDSRMLGQAIFEDHDLIRWKMAARTDLFVRMQELGVLRDDIPAAVVAQLLGAIDRTLIGEATIFPKEDRVPFEEMVRGIGLLLDRGLAPDKGRGNRKAARALIVEISEAMCTTLEGETHGKS